LVVLDYIHNDAKMHSFDFKIVVKFFKDGFVPLKLSASMLAGVVKNAY
jgi:hypothetical protein